MNREIQTYYEERFKMMSTTGWTDLIQDVEVMIEATDKVSGIEDAKALHFKQGELSILRWIKHLRDASIEVYDQLQEETEETLHG
jgi:hypothetical protein